MFTYKYDFKKIYDLIYEMVNDLQYVHDMSFADSLILNDKLVFIYNRNINSNYNKFGIDLQQYVSIVDDTLKLELEQYDDRYQYIIKTKW